MPGRRTFLKVGLAGTALLVLAGAAHARTPYRAASGAEPLGVLDESDHDVLAAIVPVLLAGTNSVVHIEAVIGSIDRAVAGLPPHLQKEVKQLFALLAFAPARKLLAGVSATWSDASSAEVATFLQRWRTSRFAMLQQAYLALHELVVASWYARPDAWPGIGYPGPPRLGA